MDAPAQIPAGVYLQEVPQSEGWSPLNSSTPKTPLPAGAVMSQRLWEIKEVLEELWAHEQSLHLHLQPHLGQQSLHLLNPLWAVPSFGIPIAEGTHDPDGRVWAKLGIVHWTVHPSVVSPGHQPGSPGDRVSMSTGDQTHRFKKYTTIVIPPSD